MLCTRPLGLDLGGVLGIACSAWEGVGRDIREHAGEGYAARDQKAVDAAEPAQRGVSPVDGLNVWILMAHIR